MEWIDLKECEGKKRTIVLNSGRCYTGTIFRNEDLFSRKIIMIDRTGNKISFYPESVEAIETIKGVKDGE
jgi:hypothetical protein